MSNLKIGAQTRHLRLPLRKALLVASQIGAEGLELELRNELPLADLSQTASREIRKITSDLGLRIAATTFPTRRGLDDTSDLEQRLDALRRAMRATYDLGARVLVVRLASTLPEDEDPRRATLVESLLALAYAGDRTGVRLAVETIGDPAALAALLEEGGGGSLGISLEPAQLLAQGHSPLEALGPLGNHIAHVHASDAVRDLARGGTMGVELGRGSVDMPELLAALDSLEYDGWFMVGRADSPSPEEEMANAITFLKSVSE